MPLGVAWFAWKLPNRLLRILRAITFALVVLAMARFAIRLPDRSGTVVVVADRSLDNGLVDLGRGSEPRH